MKYFHHWKVFSLVSVILASSFLIGNYLKVEAKDAQSSFLGQISSSVKNFKESANLLFEKTFSGEKTAPDYEISLDGVNSGSPEKSGFYSGSKTKFCSFNADGVPVRETNIINEIAWMGTNEEAVNEWIEIKNIADEEINISGWQLINKNERLKVSMPLNAKIPAHGFYLLERKEEAVPSVKADALYVGNLKNSDEGLRLFDSDCSLIDEVLAGPTWPAGENNKNWKRTMERNLNNFFWHSSETIGGTAKEENSAEKMNQSGVVSNVLKVEAMTTDSNSANNSTSSTQVFPCVQENLGQPTRAVLINEVAWAGTAGNKTSDEWLELKNNSGGPVNLDGWQILSKDANIKVFFEGGDSLASGSYFFLERTDDNTVPNLPADKFFTGAIKNSDETLRLFDRNCRLIDEVLTVSSGDKNWLFGSASPDYRTAERSSDLSWHTYSGNGSNGVFGTPKAQNSEGQANDGNQNPPPPPPSPPSSYLLTISKSGSGQGIISSNPAGINCGSDCRGNYDAGTQVILTATPENNSTFAGWSGTCSGIGDCLLTMNSEKSVNAVFDLAIPPPPQETKVLISEIMVGKDENAGYEFVEIYNAGASSVDLTGWSIKKRNASGNESSLVASSRFEGKIIQPNKYLLLAHDSGYDGNVSADVLWPASYSLAYTNNAVIIYNAQADRKDEAAWTEIPKDQSFERESWESNQFHIQPNPAPQNSQS